MRNKKLFVTLSFIVLHLIAFSQVQLQTGAAQISIPLYSYTDAGNRIGTAVSLDYTAGNGLKVNEMASSVGTGWQLSLGGVITRIQHGQPDDQRNDGAYNNYNNDFSSPDANDFYQNLYYPNGYLYSEFDPSVPVDNGGGYSKLVRYPGVEFLPRKKYLADREQDEFEFAFNGRDGRFVIGKNGSIQTTTNSKLQIEFDTANMWSSGIRTKIASFQIKDENGIRYIFHDLELNELVKYNQTYIYKQTGVPDRKLRYGQGTGQYTVSKWYLSEIVNPFTNNKISFTYDTYDIDLNTTASLQNLEGGPDGSKTLNQLWLKMKGKGKRIRSIICSGMEKVNFTYSDIFRADFPTDNALASISVEYNGITKYSWNFSFGYFFNTNIISSDITSEAYDTLNTRMVRLCLTSLQKKGAGINEQPYQFDYNLDHRIANMFTYYHDHWGYANNDSRWGMDGGWDETYSLSTEIFVNGAGNPLTDPDYFRGVASNYAATGLIKTIHYPLGGSLTFEYEQNSVIDGAGIAQIVGGVRVNKTSVFDGMDHANDIITEYKYLKEDGVTSSGWGGYETMVYSQTMPLRIYKSGDTYKTPANSALSIPSALPGVLSRAAKNADYLSTHEGTDLVAGYLASMAEQVAVVVIVDYLLNTIKDYFEADFKDYSIQESFADALNGNNSLPVMYSRVQVVQKTGILTNGQTVYEFTSDADYPLVRPSTSLPYSDAPRYEQWKYGLPKTMWIFDQNNNPVKRVEYVYNPISTPVDGDANFLSQKWMATSTYEDDDDNTPYVTETNNIAHDFYYPLLGRMELTQTKEYVYNSNSETSEITTDYTYSTGNYQLKKQSTTNSKGETIETNTYYPLDYSLTGVYKTMRDSNLVNTPVATQSFITKNGNTYALNGGISEFDFVSNGDIRVVKNYALQTTQPVDKSFVEFSATTLIPSTQYYKEQQQISYNSLGLLEKISSNSRSVGKLYNHENKLITADIANGSGGESIFDSFEENNGWNGISFDNSTVHLGKYAGRLDNLTETEKKYYNSNWINLSLTRDTRFKISGWMYSDNPDGGILVRMQTATGSESYTGVWTTQKTVNKWIYLENEFTVPANVIKLSVGVSNTGGFYNVMDEGTVWFDDIRLCPSNARMVTYTYDPLIGITSQTDANNRTVYYEYDGLGRLIRVLDNDRNILKKYCYNYAGQPESCPLLTVGNDVKTQTFRKNDCDASSGYYGSEVAYDVPADKYFGVDKIAANTLAQEEIDREGQAYANLNGTCTQGVPNDEKSQTFTRTCSPGKTGSQVTYVVPAGKYAAATKLEANQLADEDITQNGQAYADAHGTCLCYSDPIDADFYSQVCASNQTPAPYHVIIPAGAFTSTTSISDANYYAQWEAQRQADTYGECSNSAPIYARLEVSLSYSDNTSDYNQYGGMDYNYYQQITLYIRFYSDATCTQPFTLTSDVAWSVNSSEYHETESSSEVYGSSLAFQGTASAGTSEVFIDDQASFEGLWGSTDDTGAWMFYEKWSDDYQLNSVGGNVIIASPVYPAHSNGF